MNFSVRLKIVFISSLFVSCLQTIAQSFDNTLKKLYAEYREEKLYLHFDKDNYYPGETIWFKAYLFSGSFPSEISKIVYGDILDDKGIVLQHKILPVMQSTSSSSFNISASVTGWVTVRCYTKWMLNFGSSLIYEKRFYISKNFFDIAQPKSSPDNSPANKLEFFPESGSLIEDVESRLAFKATDTFGYPANISGTISNNIDSSVIFFQTMHDGMGSISFTPLKNATYKATWRQGTKIFSATLPVLNKTGINLEVNSVENAINYILRRPEGKPVSPFVYIVAQMNQQLVYRAKVSIEKEEITGGSIPVVGLPSGVIQISVFTQQEIAVAERHTFINLKQCSVPVIINSAQCNLVPRINNIISLEIPDSISSNLSVSVTSSDQEADPDKENIYSVLLLQSVVKGEIDNPGYYFSGADSASYCLDLVMMTNEFRTVRWDEILAGRFPVIRYKPETSLLVEGEIKGISTKELENKDLIGIVELKSGNKQFLSSPISQDGKFGFPDLMIFDSAKLYCQVNDDRKGSLTDRLRFKVSQQILSEGIQMPLKSYRSELIIPVKADDSRNYKLYQGRQKQVDSINAKTLVNVTVTAQKKSKKDLLNDEFTSGAFSDQTRSHTIIPDDDPSFLGAQNLFEYLKGRFPGLSINSETDKNPISRRNFTTALFVDEISQTIVTPFGELIEDGDYISTIPMTNVAMVKIFDPPFIGAIGNGPGGALAVYLKRKGSQTTKSTKEFNTIRGFTPITVFYSPDYSIDTTNKGTDFRTTLFWSPSLNTNNSNRNISFSFYSNDFPGATKIVIEGCNHDGKLIRLEKFLKCEASDH